MSELMRVWRRANLANPVVRRKRHPYARLQQTDFRLPDLVEIQLNSFQKFLDVGIQKTFTDISPIEDYTGSYAVEFGESRFEEPPVSAEECMTKDKTYAAPLFVKVRFIVKETGEVREHPYQEERFVEILSGKLRARMGKDEQSFGKGESLTVSSGTPHTWRNAGEDEVRMLVEIRPALRMEEVFETTFNLARDGKTDQRCVPKDPLQAAATAWEYSDELRLARPPFAVQKVLLGLLAPVLRLLGYGGRYPKHGDPGSSPP